jgi:phosphomevalonate kinase
VGIKLRANNDFYSQIDTLNEKNLDRTSENLLKHVPPFAPCPLVDPSNPAAGVKVAKTGLGSSAALSSSLVGSLLQHFGVIHLDKSPVADADKAYIHNIAQFAHSLAQGKIGSGFDVAAAVYGSQMYKRFDPELLEAVLKHYQPNINPTNNSTASARVFNSKFYDLVMGTLALQEADPSGLPWQQESPGASCWNQTISPVATPPGVELMMGDVHGGSNTPAMAKKVLAWQKEKAEEATPLVQRLGASNEEICKLMSNLTTLSASDPSLYNQALRLCSTSKQAVWASAAGSNTVVDVFVQLKTACGVSRSLLRRMGELAGVEIEPPCQTALVDATEAVTGVLCAGVPGAGGVDAIYALVLSADARKAVERVWGSWEDTFDSESKLQFVCPLTLTMASNAGVALESLPW